MNLYSGVAKVLICLFLLSACAAVAGPPSGAGGSTNLFSRKDRPKTWQELMKDAARDLDRLRDHERKWGAISFAPLVFAPTTYRPRGTDGTLGAPKGSFAIEEATGDKALNLSTFYGDFGLAEGEASFTQRVLTRNFGGLGTQALPIEAMQFKEQLEDFNRNRELFRGIQETQAAAFQNSFTRGQDGTKLKDNAFAEQLNTARKNLSDAQSVAVAASREAADKKLAADNANAVLTNENRKLALMKQNPTQNADAIRLQELVLFDAQTAATNATAAQQLADSRNASATSTLNTSQTAATAAENALNAQLGASPFDFTKNPGTLLTPTGNTLAFPTITGPSSATLPITEAKPLFDAAKTDPGTFKVGPDPTAPALRKSGEGGTFNPLARVTAAAGAALAKEVFTFLGNPEAAEAFREKKLLFGVSSITVNPGFNTRKDFTANVEVTPTMEYTDPQDELVRQVLQSTDYPLAIRKRVAIEYPSALTDQQRTFFAKVSAGSEADCNVTLDKLEDHDRSDKFGRAYKDLKDHGLPIQKDGKPESMGTFIINAVSPLVDVQNLDLASSLARQDEVALFLSATLAQAGLRGQASTFNQWVRQRRKDVATRSTVAVATSYTLAGGVFGFEIGPRLRALADPDARKSESAMILDRQAFPILILLGLNEDTARPLIMWGSKKSDEGVRGIRLWQLRATFTYHTNWTRNSQGLLSIFKPKRNPSDVVNELFEIQDIKENYEDKFNGFLNSFQDGKEFASFDRFRRQILSDFESFSRKLYGARFSISLPAAWLSPNLADRTETFARPVKDLTINSNDLILTPSSLEMKNTKTDTDPTGTAKVVLSGANLSEIDISAIGVSSGKAQVTAVSLLRPNNPDIIALDLTVQGAEGEIQLVLPLKAKSPIADFMGTTTILSRPLPYRIEVAREPVIQPLTKTAYTVVGAKQGDAFSGSFQVLLQGANLDYLGEQPILRSGGESQRGMATLVSAGKNAAILNISLLGPAAGDLFLELPVKPGTRLDRIFSPSFSYKIVESK